MRVVDLALVADYTMPSGLGNLGKRQACVVAQAAIVDAVSQGKTITKLTDKLVCACPVLRILAIALNDVRWWKSDEERSQILTPLISLLLDSKVSAVAVAKRALKAAGYVEYAAKYAKSAAKYAEYAGYVQSAKYAAKYAESAAKTVEEYAEESAKYAESAAKTVEEYAEESAKYAESAAKSMEHADVSCLRELRRELLETFYECEAIQGNS